MSFRQIATANAPGAIGPYSQGVVANGFLFTAGQIAFDPATMEIVGTEIQAQTAQALKNLKAVVEASGSSFEKVYVVWPASQGDLLPYRLIKTTVFLKDMNDFAKMNEIYAAAFGASKPARSAVEVARLPRDVLVEIDSQFMSLRQIVTKLAPKAIGPYSQGVVAGGFVYTAGQCPFDPVTLDIVGTEIQGQTKQSLANLKAVVEAGGSSFKSIVKTTVFLKDMNDFAKMNEIYSKAFEGNQFPPARSAVEVARLPKDVLVEIECVAVVEKAKL
ncbi:hypothetical protein HDU98_010554 [Podochytrium sp. JEL0797]|nr:hypothetical protein HDU98_010554 [Podochytrium sp. JEL0797]